MRKLLNRTMKFRARLGRVKVSHAGPACVACGKKALQGIVTVPAIYEADGEGTYRFAFAQTDAVGPITFYCISCARKAKKNQSDEW